MYPFMLYPYVSPYRISLLHGALLGTRRKELRVLSPREVQDVVVVPRDPGEPPPAPLPMAMATRGLWGRRTRVHISKDLLKLC